MDISDFDFDTVEGWGALNEKQRAFVIAFLKKGNSAEAARAAGYSPRSADVTGCKLKKLPQVRAVLKNAASALQNGEALTIGEAQAILGRIARGRVANFYNEHGRIDFGKVQQEKGEIDSISVSSSDGDKSSSHSEHLKLRDPVSAIKLAGQLAGWFEKDDVEAKSVGTVNYVFNFGKREALPQ